MGSARASGSCGPPSRWARLLESQGRREAARSRLAAALDGMGRETELPEVDQARSLLNRLGR